MLYIFAVDNIIVPMAAVSCGYHNWASVIAIS